jgi:NAD(P)-dependent dehydrogenase (short-subunit alcohol dehydrogenase family)
MDLQDRVAFVTGGGSGMGRATARRLAEQGMKVCVADINGKSAANVAEEIGGMAVSLDVGDFEAMDAAMSVCIDRFGGLDLAYLNAGIAGAGNIEAFDLAAYQRMLGVNQNGVIYGAACAVKHMRNRSGGSSSGVIVATSSIAGIEPFLPDPFYTLTKHAVVGFIRAIGGSLAPEGISAHVICPAMTDTGLLGPGTKERMLEAGRDLLPAEAIADTVVLAATSPIGASGTCWVVQYGRPPYPFEFTHVEGHVSFGSLEPKT